MDEPVTSGLRRLLAECGPAAHARVERERYYANPEPTIRRAAEWRKAHPDLFRAMNSASQKRHRPARRVYRRAWERKALRKRFGGVDG